MDNLRTRWEAIRDEKIDSANTAKRVGDAGLATIQVIEETKEELREAVSTIDSAIYWIELDD